MNSGEKKKLNFIEQIVHDDIEMNKHEGRVHTRFPPEPNGYLHIGHAKSICLNFGLAETYGGKTNLRFDDTNPTKEETEYVDAIKKDVEWLGFKWDGKELYASDYFEQLYDFAEQLIKDGKAFVDDSTVEEIREMRGTPTVPMTPSPYRDRSPAENLELFREMRAGKHPAGSKVLRAKISLTSPNMHLRDPIMYRILFAHHHRTGDTWCIYPMYDYAHGQSDSIEKITHSVCTLEFENHRPLYKWFIKQLGIFPSRQIEFARLNLNYTVMSKRKLLQLVEEGLVTGWDDPRMPTISGLRRRGYSPAAVKNFATRVGVAKRDNVIDLSLLEFSVREDLNKTAARVMGVLNPIKLVITNYPEDKTEDLTLVNNPEDETMGSRTIPFSKYLYIERTDFMEDPPKKYFRLGPGKDVRLKGAYIIHCEDFVKDENGEVTEVHATYYPDSKSGSDSSGVKSKGVIHFVSQKEAVPVDIRLYDRLFDVEAPLAQEDKDFTELINPDSLKVINNAMVEPSLATAKPGDRFQFMRMGYFCVDPDSTENKLIFNRTVTLKDGWKKKS